MEYELTRGGRRQPRGAWRRPTYTVTGKTMLARRLPTILPMLGIEESLETTRIYSSVGLLPQGESILATRPFRSPHHTTSEAGLVGGGTMRTPGEVSLAHHGIPRPRRRRWTRRGRRSSRCGRNALG